MSEAKKTTEEKVDVTKLLEVERDSLPGGNHTIVFMRVCAANTTETTSKQGV